MFHKAVTNALMKGLQVCLIVWLLLNQMVWIFLWSERVAFLFRSVPNVLILTAIEQWSTEPHSEQGQKSFDVTNCFYHSHGCGKHLHAQNSLWWPSDRSTSSLKWKTSVLKTHHYPQKYWTGYNAPWVSLWKFVYKFVITQPTRKHVAHH